MPKLEDVVIISAVRTPVGKFQGSLSDFRAPELGAIVVREAVKRASVDPARVDECIMGNVVSAGLGQNPARQAARKTRLKGEWIARRKRTVRESSVAMSLEPIESVLHTAFGEGVQAHEWSLRVGSRGQEAAPMPTPAYRASYQAGSAGGPGKP